MSRPARFLAPPDFHVGDRSHVFVKFVYAQHLLDLDARGPDQSADSVVHFESFSRGHPLFDLESAGIRHARLDGVDVEVEDVSPPDGVTTYRTLASPVDPGLHRLEIAQRQPLGVEARGDGRVLCEFPFVDGDDTDLADEPAAAQRFFLERYLPANLEFDRHPFRIGIRIRNADAAHRLLTNGCVDVRGPNEWVIDFPSWFCSSSPFVRLLAPDPVLAIDRQEVARADGSKIRVRVVGHGRNAGLVQALSTSVGAVLLDLQARFGPFPFDRYLVFAEEAGMEYAGACSADSPRLLHETIHNYFGRCLAPVDGNAGWVDEAIATWCSDGCTGGAPSPEWQGVKDRSAYARSTPPLAWSAGAGVIGALDAEIESKGGMQKFLREWFLRRRFQQYTAASFQRDLEEFAGRPLSHVIEPREP